MANLWAGRFSKGLDEQTNDFNSSIGVDGRMFSEDIMGSIAHAAMLGKQGIISAADSDLIVGELGNILEELLTGKLAVDPQCEDIHTFVENTLTARLGDVGKRLHTARSRNDQVATDTRLYVLKKIKSEKKELVALIKTLCEMAKTYSYAIMPGYTHLQRAQPIAFGHQLMAYANMFLRDLGRLSDCANRAAVSPLGSCALAGTTYNIDRFMTAKALGFAAPCENSIDGVSDRDYLIELANANAIIMMHLSRFSEEVIMWCSWEFKFLELDDAFSTGSSIMPQKKNPDIAELVRGKTGRVYGDLITILTIMKGLPLAYNKDMQEDKESIFDSIDTVLQCVPIFNGMLASATVLTDNMAKAGAKGFINATDCADYLVTKGVPFRTAYKVTGQLVAYCISKNTVLEELDLSEFNLFDSRFDKGVYEAINLNNCLNKRTSYGGACSQSVVEQAEKMLSSIDAKLYE